MTAELETNCENLNKGDVLLLVDDEGETRRFTIHSIYSSSHQGFRFAHVRRPGGGVTPLYLCSDNCEVYVDRPQPETLADVVSEIVARYDTLPFFRGVLSDETVERLRAALDRG